MAHDDPPPYVDDDEPVPASAEPARTIVSLSDTLELDVFPSEQGGDPPPDTAPPIAADDRHAAPIPAHSTAPVAADAGTTPAVMSTASPGTGASSPLPDGAATASTDPFVPRLVDRPDRGVSHADARDDSLTLAELIDRNNGLDWREAVSVVHELCMALRDAPTQAVLIEPRNIEVSARGKVRLLPGPSSGEALVVQLGRLFRTMLMGRSIPPDLRLLLSQATFEVPILHSIEDVDRKLREFCHLDDGEGLRGAFARASAPRSDGITAPLPLLPPAPVRPILPAPSRRRRLILSREYWRSAAAPRDGLLLSALLVGLAVLTGLTIGRVPASAPDFSQQARTAPAADPAAAAVGSGGTSASARPASTLPAVEPAPGRQVAQPSPTRAATRAPSNVKPAPEGRTADGDPPSAVGTASRSRATAAVPPAPSPRESERRAAALIAEGQAVEAAMAFDALVMSNPLYEPSRHQLTPEAYSAFQSSRRELLPVIALKEYETARAALSVGNFDRAIASGNMTLSVLDRVESEPPDLRERATAVVEEATLARLSADEIIYTTSSPGVIPPRPLSRQFPLSGPPEVPPHRVGTLDMIVGKTGEVEFVKLHTPLNRYHERMVVSAAKAWRYRPATRSGKPVRFRLTVRINLPESGTDPY